MRSLTLLALLALSSCAVSRASGQQINDAAVSVIGCLQTAAKHYDDPKSDAATVGYGITGICSSEINRAIEIASQGFNYENRQAIKQRLTAYSQKTATAIVLEERAAGR